MDRDPVDDLVGRLEHLERANQGLVREARRLRRAGIGLALGMVVALVAGARLADSPGDVVTERFVLKDRFGQPRLTMAVEPDGRAALSFLDKDAKPRLALSVRPVGLPAIDWTDQAGKVRLSLSLDAF